jgi:hypothetical protein
MINHEPILVFVKRLDRSILEIAYFTFSQFTISPNISPIP